MTEWSYEQICTCRKIHSRIIEKEFAKQELVRTFLPHFAQKANQTATCDMTVRGLYMPSVCSFAKLRVANMWFISRTAKYSQ